MLRWAFDGLGVDAFKKNSRVISKKKGRLLHCTYHLLHSLIYQHSYCCPSHCRSPSMLQRTFAHDQSASFIIDSAGNSGV